MLKHRNKDKGFTLIEIIVTMTIIAMLAAFVVPTFIGYIETGNQTKRMNIAKTIYLAAQNQLTEKKINQTLGTFSLTKEEADAKTKSASVKETEAEAITEYATKFVENINNTLPEKMPPEEKANIVYISKSQGVASGKVYELLDSVIQDKSVLNNAILIEYNKTTGFVLSVFYSEETGGSDEGQFALTYAEPDKESNNDFEKYSSVNGGRPYTFADERRQGYCGIEETGMLPPTGKEVIINVKDGKKSPLSDGTGGSYENVLYAEVLIPESMIKDGKKYNMQMLSEKRDLIKLLPGAEALKANETGLISLDKLQNTVDSASKNKLNGNIIFSSIFNEDSKALPEDADNKDYARIIWVLDYVNGDMLSQDNSIGLKILPQNIRVGISGDGINAKSLSVQNSHFAYETQDKSIVGSEKSKSFITSARHLNNIRYKLDGDFRQLDDIDMKVNSKTEITNFLPIGLNPLKLSYTSVGKFTGKYFGRKSEGTYSIKNLKIDINESDNVGLFADIEGKTLLGAYTEGIITGLILENPSIIGRNYVGTLAGSNSGQISMVTVEKNKPINGPIVQGAVSIGGIVGKNSGVLSKLNLVNKNEEKISLIKGTGYEVGGIAGRSSGRLDDIVVISSSSAAVASGIDVENTTYTGGVVGLSSAQMDRVMYLAVAPKFRTTAGEKISPIVGLKSGTITNAIYLSGEAKRPTPITEPSNNGYNLESPNFGEPKSTKGIIKEVSWKNWKKTDGSGETNMISVYPYPYQISVPYKIDEYKNWPVVDEDGGVAELGYYEMYSDDTFGYSNSKTQLIKNDKELEKEETEENSHVINDGYFIDYPKTSGEYTFQIESSDKKKVFTLKNTDWEWNDKVFLGTRNLSPLEYTKDGKVYLRLFLRNNILETLAENSTKNVTENINEITVIVKKGTIEILNTKMNPLFAPSDKTIHIIRSPRHLDNIDKVELKKETVALRVFLQDLNIDFEKYSRELKLENNKLSTDSETKISKEKSIVAGEFSGIYNGNNKYIRDVVVDGSGILNWGVDRTNIGLFEEIKGTVKNIALLKSSFKGKQIVGGIAGTLAKGSKIENCELSEVIVENTEIGSGNAIGGVVGKNQGILNNIYFNSTYRENGVYSTPIKSSQSNTVGGVVGNNKDGIIKNSYITAVGPWNNSGKINIIAGGEGALENVYYLNVGDYNRNVSENQGEAFNLDGSLVKDNTKKISNYLNDGWETANVYTTKETFNCKGLVYPYPKISRMNHYFDWPVLINTLKYFEEYSDKDKGYYFYNGDNITDTLRYDNPDITVVDEGYVVEVLSEGNYDIKFNSSYIDRISNIQSEILDGKIVIRLKHSQVEKLIEDANITKDGIKPVQIEVFKKDGTQLSSDILETEGKKTYFNPLFPKQIYYYGKSETVLPVKSLEIRSPRHMLNGSKVQIEESARRVISDKSYPFDIINGPDNIANGKKAYVYDSWFPYGKSPVSQDFSEGSFYFYDYNSSRYGIKSNFEVSSESVSETDPSKIVENIDGSYTVTEVNRTYDKKIIETFEMKELRNLWWGNYYGYRLTAFGTRYDQNPSYWRLIARQEEQIGHEYTKITNVTKNMYKLKQTISINFGGPDGRQTIGNLAPYTWEKGYNVNKAKISNNIISTLYSDYDAGVYFQDGKYYGNETSPIPVTGSDGRTKRNRIYNLVMNSGSGTGGAFGTVESGVTVKNIEFVDPQIRLENGRGGGIVTNINYGIIDNIQVYNKQFTRSLFADVNGETNRAFCQSGNNSNLNYGSNLGGIAGQSVSKKDQSYIARITNCIVGTNSNNISDVVDKQKTLIYCHTATGYGSEWATNRIGGIVGFVYGNAEIISSTNIAEIEAWYDSANSNNLGSPFSIGGIAGAIGIRNVGGQNSSSFIGSWMLSDIGQSPGHIIGCYNVGNVKLKNGWIAGIAGYPATGSTVISCYNTGRINIEKKNGKLEQIQFLSGQPIRIGGIVGESDGARILNCYNIGYMSGNISGQSNSAAGSIMALPAYKESFIENCYSLKAVEFPPNGLIGKLWNNAVVNGLNNVNDINNYFSGIFITKNQLRNNLELVSDEYQTNGYINLEFTKGNDKFYPVFSSSIDSFYIYPQLTKFKYGGVDYSNPHITPWEYIDSKYDVVLNYYEKYAGNTFGYSYLDVFGNLQSTLSNDKIVVEDGYFIETGMNGTKYKIEINGTVMDKEFTSMQVFGNKLGILFTEDLKNKLNKKSSYSRIRVYTSGLKDEDNINRLIGTNTVKGEYGKDIYMDYRFPKEIKYGLSEDNMFDVTKLKPESEPYYIRAPRHILSISNANVVSKAFIQENNIDFSTYNGGNYIRNSLVAGEFEGSYNAQGCSIFNLKLNNETDTDTGIFESIGEKASVVNLRVVTPKIDGKGDVGVIAGLNKGKIKGIVIEKPDLKGVSKMGAVCGYNQGDILDICIMDYGNHGETSFIGGTEIGGITGKNEGKLTRVLFVAKAPEKDSKYIPITYSNNGKLEDVYFLSGSGYNELHNNIGIPKITSEFREIDIINWYEWIRKEKYPYPYLISIPTGSVYPIVEK